MIQSEYSFVVFKYYLRGYYCTLTRDCQSNVLMYLIQDICAEDGAQLVRWTSALRRPQRSEDLNPGFRDRFGTIKENLKQIIRGFFYYAEDGAQLVRWTSALRRP